MLALLFYVSNIFVTNIVFFCTKNKKHIILFIEKFENSINDKILIYILNNTIYIIS